MKISIIIPVFNSGEYLARCLNSVLGAVKDVDGEILAVDNGSNDNSLEILKEYGKKYPKLVKVLQCNTPGAGAVRNFAVTKAKGEYIWFVDADDEITKDSAKKLIAKADETKADLVMLGLARVYPDGHRERVAVMDPTDPDYKKKFIMAENGPVQVLIRRKWYTEHNFKFLEGVIHEDMDLVPALVLYTDKFESIDETFYLYYQNSDSVLHKTSWDSHYFDIYMALESLYERFEKAGVTKEYHDELEWFFIWNLLVDSAKYYGKFKEGRSGFARSRQMLKKYFPNWRKNKYMNQKKISPKFKLWLRLSYWGIVI